MFSSISPLKDKVRELALFSPAKCNLTFRVLFKRPDGFHEISSLNQALSLGDILEISLSSEDQFHCDDPTLPLDVTNLVCQALSLFREKTGLDAPISIRLKKQIPRLAGLGGGSSNAATMLFGLNRLFDAKIEESQLARWGSELGSDIPFFFSSGRAKCLGRGEKIHSLPPTSSQSLWIAKPKFGLSTPEVYRALEKALQVEESVTNDLERGAFFLSPKLKAFKDQLKDLGFSKVSMTGSGTAFCCFGDVDEPNHTALRFIKAHFLFRSSTDWYKFPA